MSLYVRHPVTAPRVSGAALRLFASLVESPLRGLVLGKMLRDSGVELFRRAFVHDASTLQPPLPAPPARPALDRAALVQAALGWNEDAAASHNETAAFLSALYASGRASPTSVAERVIEAIERSRRPEGNMGWFISSQTDDVRAQAEASARRWRAGAPLSPLDGVPVAVKDEIHQAAYATTAGTAFLGRAPAASDATLVARLRAAGALLIGKTNMHEIGISTLGINPHHGAARNPHDPERMTGGSSSGSGAVVAAGICPLALGGDGGGSVRIPAALCGVVGLKPTHGRLSTAGGYPLCWSVGHLGILGATSSDVATAYALIAGVDPADANTHAQPPPHLEPPGTGALDGLRLGVHRAYFEDAAPDVVRRCDELVAAWVSAGARVVEIPPPDLNLILWTHTVLILSEMATSLSAHDAAHHHELGLDARINLAVGRSFTSVDYAHALRHRRKMTLEQLALMEHVDVVVTPTTAATAPPIPVHALPSGESNLALVDALMRFVRLANLTGFPALSVPAGHDAAGLPVGCHLTARPWEEHLLLRLAAIAERHVERRRPRAATSLVA